MTPDVLLRYLQASRPLNRLADLALACTCAALVALIIGYITRPAFDRAWFVSGLQMSSMVESRTSVPGAASWRLVDASLARTDRASGGARSSDLTRSMNARLFIVDRGEVERVNRVVAGMTAGSALPPAGGVLIDAASAHRLRLRVGDAVGIVSYPESQGFTECTGRISGITRSYYEPDGVDGGLAVSNLPCVQRIPTSSAMTVDPVKARGETKTDLILQSLIGGSSLILMAIAGMTLMMWRQAMRRASRGILLDQSRAARALLSMGVPGRALRRAARLQLMAVALVGSVVGVAVARWVMSEGTGFYIQTPHALIIITLMLLLSLLMSSRLNEIGR